MKKGNQKCIVVLGGGAWGTALAKILTQAGHDTTLWFHTKISAQEVENKRENLKYLPGVRLPEILNITSDLSVLQGAEVVFSVLPLQHTSPVLREGKSYIPPKTPVVCCSKGIELQSARLPHDILKETVPQGIPAILSGPNFATNVATGMPCATTIACADPDVLEDLLLLFSKTNLRPYGSDDLLGTAIAGGVKNVIAIACGISDAKGLGESTRAGLMTRGLMEIMRLGLSMGAKAETFMGLSGMGDLVLTCSSVESRNYRFGHDFCKGHRTPLNLAEGFYTSQIVLTLAKEKNLELPICQGIYDILYHQKNVDDVILELLSRPVKTYEM